MINRLSLAKSLSFTKKKKQDVTGYRLVPFAQLLRGRGGVETQAPVHSLHLSLLPCISLEHHKVNLNREIISKESLMRNYAFLHSSMW